MRPLLLAHSVACPGPWTPTRDLEGMVEVKGLVPGEDTIHIYTRGADGKVEREVMILEDMEIEVNLKEKDFINATHAIASGKEVFVWVS